MANDIYRNQPLGINLTFVDQDGAPVSLAGAVITVDYWKPDDKGAAEPTGTWATAVDGVVISIISEPLGTALCVLPENVLNVIGTWTDQPRALISGLSWPGTASNFTVLEKGKVPA